MAFDPKLIPLFDGIDSGQLVKSVEKVELICQLSGVKCTECILPMCWSGEVVYKQLSKKKKTNFACIKSDL